MPPLKQSIEVAHKRKSWIQSVHSIENAISSVGFGFYSGFWLQIPQMLAFMMTVIWFYDCPLCSLSLSLSCYALALHLCVPPSPLGFYRHEIECKSKYLLTWACIERVFNVQSNLANASNNNINEKTAIRYGWAGKYEDFIIILHRRTVLMWCYLWMSNHKSNISAARLHHFKLAFVVLVMHKHINALDAYGSGGK